MVTAFLTAYAFELACGGTFVAGFSVYSYIKLKGKTNPHRLVWYNLSDREIKHKKMQQRINDRAGGGKNGDTFFKNS